MQIWSSKTIAIRNVMAMKMLEGLALDNENLHSLAKRKLRKKGIFRTELLERFEVAYPIWRVFRCIHFHDSTNEIISTSLLDEGLAPFVSGFEESLLLWRPRYDGLNQVEAPIDISLNDEEKNRIEVLESIVNELITIRQAAQNELIGLSEEFVKTQVDWKSTASLLLPRSPSSIREQEEIAKKKRTVDGIVNASSLVINSSSDSIVESMTVGDCVFVETVLIKYTAIENGSVRILALENPSAESIEDTVSRGRALTRLSEVNHSCKNVLIATAFNHIRN